MTISNSTKNKKIQKMYLHKYCILCSNELSMFIFYNTQMLESYITVGDFFSNGYVLVTVLFFQLVFQSICTQLSYHYINLEAAKVRAAIQVNTTYYFPFARNCIMVRFALYSNKKLSFSLDWIEFYFQTYGNVVSSA